MLLFFMALLILLVVTGNRIIIGMRPVVQQKLDVTSASVSVAPAKVAKAQRDIQAGQNITEADIAWQDRMESDDYNAPLGQTSSCLYKQDNKDQLINHQAAMAIPANALITKLSMGQDPALAELNKWVGFDAILYGTWGAFVCLSAFWMFSAYLAKTAPAPDVLEQSEAAENAAAEPKGSTSAEPESSDVGGASSV